DRDNLGVQPRDLRIFQYDLTNRRFTPDAEAGAAEAEALAGADAVEARELAKDRAVAAAGRRDHRLRRRGHGELRRRLAPAHRHGDGQADAEERHDERAARDGVLP